MDGKPLNDPTSSHGGIKWNAVDLSHDKEKKWIGVKTTWTVSKKTRINGSISYFDEEKGNSGLPDHRTPNSRSSNDMTSGLIGIVHKKLKTKTYMSRGKRRTEYPDRNLDSFLDVLEVGQEFSLPLALNIGARGIHYNTYEDTLNPEMSLGYTQGAFSWEGDGGISLSLSPFYNMIDDRISYVRASNGIGRYENLGQVIYKGVDVSLSFTPLEWASIQSGYTYLEAKDDETDLWLSAKPRHRWVTSLTPIENLTLGLTLKAVSSLYTNSKNTETAPGYLSLICGVNISSARSVCSERLIIYWIKIIF